MEEKVERKELETGKLMSAYNTKGELIEFKLRENKSKVLYRGSKWTSNSNESFTIIGNLDRRYKNNSFYYYLIEFDNGTRVIVLRSCIRLGNIKNPSTPSVFNIGVVGQGAFRPKINGVITKEYNTWKGVLERCCTSKYKEKNPTYLDCIVDERWLNFQRFCEDIPSLEGYKNWKENSCAFGYALDKDIKVKDNKVYSKDTCMFVTKSENSIKAMSTRWNTVKRGE